MPVSDRDNDRLLNQNSAENDDSSDVLETASMCEMLIDGESIKTEISEVDLRQYVDDHHVLRVKVLLSVRDSNEGDIPNDLPYRSFLGKVLSITFGNAVDGGNGGKGEFVGVVTEVNFENRVDGLNVMTITAHSPTISMDGAKRHRLFNNQSPSDIVKATLNDHAITQGKLDAINGSAEYYVQYRETDYDFIMRLATGAGLFAFYDGKNFNTGKASSSNSVSVAWREMLGSFKLGLGTAQQEFNAQVYNYSQAQNFTQDTKSVSARSSLSQLSKASPDASKQIYKQSGYVGDVRMVDDTRSLDDEVVNARSRAMSSMITCVGQSIEPTIRIGGCVKIEKMGPLNNQYWVTSVRHVIKASGMYHNEFTCVPLDIAFPQSKSNLEQATQIQSAIVTDNNDPEQLGRLKVKFPWLENEEYIWARIAVPHAGEDRGWYSLPEIGDEVLVGFQLADPTAPVILGGVYNSNARPPSAAQSSDNDIKVFCTRGGSQILIDDKSGSEKLTITTKDGKNSIVLDASGQTIAIESDGDISVKGKNVAIESQMELKLKAGTNLKLEAGANLETKATAQYKAEGATVNLQGQAMVEVKGAMIKLN